MVFVKVIYEEGKPETYKGIALKWDGGRMVINTGNFLTDAKTMVSLVTEKFGPETHMLFSSSFDQYLQEGGYNESMGDTE